MKAAFHTLGCKTNAYETQAIREQFERAGFEIVSFTEAADVYVINTCSVTAVAAQKSRQMLSRCRKLSPDALVAACGCYAQEASERLKESGVDLVIGNNEKSALLGLVQKRLAARNASGKETAEPSGEEEEEKKTDETVIIDDMTHCHQYEEQEISHAGSHVRAYVKIQDGCNRFCSYCIIPYLRGRSRSRKPEEILREVRTLAASGIREIVLTGIDISDYQAPEGEGKTASSGALAELILAIEEIEAVERIRLGSLEAGIITGEFLEKIAESRKLCPHFHLSLQSGCDETLARMNRDYTAREFAESLARIRSVFPDPAVTTDVIAGFAGESEEEFEKTLQFVEKAAFSELHVFPYSRRKGTRADKMPGQLTRAEKAERCKRLIRLGKELQRSYMQRFIGRPVKILTEETVLIEGKECLTGFTPEYIRAALPGSSDNINKIVTMIPQRILEVKGEPILV